MCSTASSKLSLRTRSRTEYCNHQGAFVDERGGEKLVLKSQLSRNVDGLILNDADPGIEVKVRNILFYSDLTLPVRHPAYVCDQTKE